MFHLFDILWLLQRQKCSLLHRFIIKNLTWKFDKEIVLILGIVTLWYSTLTTLCLLPVVNLISFVCFKVAIFIKPAFQRFIIKHLTWKSDRKLYQSWESLPWLCGTPHSLRFVYFQFKIESVLSASRLQLSSSVPRVRFFSNPRAWDLPKWNQAWNDHTRMLFDRWASLTQGSCRTATNKDMLKRNKIPWRM